MRLYYLAICPAENLKMPFDRERDRDRWAADHENGSVPGHQVWIRDEDADTGQAYWGPPVTNSQPIVDRTTREAHNKASGRDFGFPHRALPEEK